MAKIVPQLSARDVDGYLAFLTRAFGFEVTEYWRDPNDANHVNVELSLDGAVVGVGRATSDRTGRQDPSAPHIGLYVIVDDVHAHYQRARAANVEINFELADQAWGHTMYGAVDPEGHEWGFASPSRAST